MIDNAKDLSREVLVKGQPLVLLVPLSPKTKVIGLIAMNVADVHRGGWQIGRHLHADR